MGILSGLGGIFHGIAHFFEGGDSNPSPVVTTTTTQVQQLPSAQKQGTGSVQDQLAQVAQVPSLHLYQGQPLQKATSATATPAPAAPTPPAPSPNPLMKAANALRSTITSSGPAQAIQAGEGVGLGVARAGEGLAQGVVDTPDLLVHGINYPLRKIAGPDSGLTKALNAQNQGADTATNVVNTPFKQVEKATDVASANSSPTSKALYKPAQVITNLAALVPAAKGALSKIGGLVSKGSAPAVLSGDAATTEATQAANTVGRPTSAPQMPEEVAPGIKSVNPTQEADAIHHAVENTPTLSEGPTGAATGTPDAANAPVNTPPNQELSGQTATSAKAPVDEGANKTGTNTIQPVDTGHSPLLVKARTVQPSPELPVGVASPTELPLEFPSPPNVAQTPNDVNPQLPTPAVIPTPADVAQAVAEGKPPVTVPVDVNGNPALVSDKTAAQAAEAAGVSPTPIEPVVPGAPNGELKNARFQQAVVDNAKDPVFKAAFQSDPIEKDGAPLSQLNEEATTRVQNMSLPELVKNYGQDFEPGHSPITNPSQYYEGLQALKQLEQYPADPTAADAAANTLRAINDFANAQGRGLAATRVAYDSLPTTMKVAYISKLVQKAGGELSAADAERLYSAADLQGKLAATAQKAEQAVSELSAKATEATPGFNQDMKTLLDIEQKADAALYDQNRAVVDILEQNLPKSDLGTRIAQNARTSMLSSIGGRVFALTGTGFNTAAHLADNTVSALAGRAINAATGSNAVRTSLIRPGTLIKGAIKGVKGLAKEVSGKGPVKSVDEHLQKPFDSEYSHDTTRYGVVGNATAPLRKAVRFGVGTHLAATKGIEDAAIEQAARQAAKDIAVPKENVQGFVNYYKAHPPGNVAEEAKQTWLGVNNLHKNGLSAALGKMADTLETAAGKSPGATGGIIQGIAKQVRVTMIPFSHYMGGFANKALTDRNMFYNAFKITQDLGRVAIGRGLKDPQAFADQFGHLTTNVGAAGGIGYILAKNGTIVTKDQDGNSYDGLYFHVGNKYIPVAWSGQAAMPIIMGARLQMDGTSGKMTDWPTNVMDDVLKATGVAGTFGDTNNVNNLLAGNTEGNVPKIVGSAVQQHIPGVSGDINAGLNYSSLNPTHEKPLTKATSTNPATGRQVTDNIQTEINKTKAAIPGLSQSLPRQPGEKAPTMIDRMLHAGESSSTQLQTAKQAADNKAAGIPDPTKANFSTAVEARIENGKYDEAIQGLQQKIAANQKDADIPKSTSTKLQDQIKQLTVLRDGKFDPSIRDLYSGTSVSEWRNMGDPTSDTYDPDKYNLLYQYDSQLAKAGVSGSTLSTSDNKYKVKPPPKGRSGSKGGGIKSNTIGSPVSLGKISFGNLAPQKVSNAATIPTIQQIQPGDLIKKRAISVTKARV